MEGAKIRRRPQWRIWIPRVWLAIVGLFVLWQTFTYRGLSALAAEWQFDAFGFYNPALTYLVLVLVLCSPLLLLRLYDRRKQARSANLNLETQVSQAISATTRLFATLIGMVAVTLVTAVAILAFMLFLPNANGPMARVIISDDAAPPPLGRVELSGQLLTNSASVFNEDFFVTRRSSRFAPMVSGSADRTILRYFVELPPEASAARPVGVSVREGVLRQGGLPGALIRLYRYAGFRVDANYYVLFASEASMRRAYLTSAIELVVMAVFIALLGGIYWYRRKRLEKLRTDTAS